MADENYDLIDRGNGVYAQCPNCSRLYATADEKGVPEDVPSKCRRCGSPMNKAAALKFADANAKRDHDPKLAAKGARLRGEAVPA